MTALTLLQEARDTDQDIQFIDALLDRATLEHAHPKVIARLVRVRNDKTRHWAELWRTRPVTR